MLSPLVNPAFQERIVWSRAELIVGSGTEMAQAQNLGEETPERL